MLYYANADKTRLVPEGSEEAAYTISDADPGEYAGLLKAEQERLEMEAKAKAEGEAAGEKPNPTVEPEASVEVPVSRTEGQEVASVSVAVSSDPTPVNRPVGRPKRGG